MKWAYGVTTVPSRFDDLLPRTLASLNLAGFDAPRLFIDGDGGKLRSHGWTYEMTYRMPRIRTYGNWILGLAELLIRNPAADRYAMFQDDFVTYKNLRQYLEKSPYPTRGYLNLYTFPSNQDVAPLDSAGRVRVGWYEARELQCGAVVDGKKQQTGRGAVALVFNRDAVLTLLQHQHMVERPLDSTYGHRKIDGGIVTAMNKAGWREYVHNPSLTQHIGDVSSMGNKPHKRATSFRGPEFDALDLLK